MCDESAKCIRVHQVMATRTYTLLGTSIEVMVY